MFRSFCTRTGCRNADLRNRRSEVVMLVIRYPSLHFFGLEETKKNNAVVGEQKKKREHVLPLRIIRGYTCVSTRSLGVCSRWILRQLPV